jgi:hypothetical protein
MLNNKYTFVTIFLLTNFVSNLLNCLTFSSLDKRLSNGDLSFKELMEASTDKILETVTSSVKITKASGTRCG